MLRSLFGFRESRLQPQDGALVCPSHLTYLGAHSNSSLLGWCIGPAHLVRPTLAATTRIVYGALPPSFDHLHLLRLSSHLPLLVAVNSPLQEATAVGFEQAAAQKFFSDQRAAYLERRNILLEALDKVGLPYTIPDGAYFVLVQNECIRLPDGYVLPDIVSTIS